MTDFALLTLAITLLLSPLLIHELGHWALLRRNGVPVTEAWIGLGPVILRLGRLRVGLLPIGAAVLPEPQAFDRIAPLTKVWVALAGPIASFAYGVALLAMALALPGTADHSTAKLLIPIASLSFFLGGLNLVPVPPLDGFQAYRYWREHKLQPFPEKVQSLATRFGNGLVYGIGFFALGRVFF